MHPQAWKHGRRNQDNGNGMLAAGYQIEKTENAQHTIWQLGTSAGVKSYALHNIHASLNVLWNGPMRMYASLKSGIYVDLFFRDKSDRQHHYNVRR